MRLVAQLEAVGAMASAVGERECPDGDGERLERGRLAVAQRLARQYAGDIRLNRHVADGVAAAGLQHADAQNATFDVLRSTFYVLRSRCRTMNLERRTLNLERRT